MNEPTRVVGWNVNGLRACIKKGFVSFLESSGADIVALQEVRAFPEQLPPEITDSPDWHASFFPAKRPGYSGVAILSRTSPSKVETSLGDARFDDEGRFIVAHLAAYRSLAFISPRATVRNVITLGSNTSWTFTAPPSTVLTSCAEGGGFTC